MYCLAGVLFAISLFHAWRYSRTSADPDWAYFNLWGFTGARYGKDFADCKTPAIHLWYLTLSRLVGRSVQRVKFTNHFLLGSVGVLIFALTGNFPASLAYTVLVNSGWLLAFHGNVGQIPAALICLAFSVSNPAIGFILWGVAVLFEPKLLPAFIVTMSLQGWFFVLMILASLAVFTVVRLQDKQWFRWLWESSVTIPVRMTRNRKGDFYKAWLPWFTSNSLLYLNPWLGLAILARPDFWYWFPAVVYAIFIASGKIVRQNHLIPLVPFIVFSGMEYVYLLAIVDFLSAGFYFGNIWARFYQALDELNSDAQRVGEWLRDKAGTVYVNGIHSGIYIHAQKPPQFGFTEQIEIREVAMERRGAMLKLWRENPPEWVVDGRMPGMRFRPVGYQRVSVFGGNTVYQKMNPIENRKVRSDAEANVYA